MSAVYTRPSTGDVVTVPDELTRLYDSRPDWERADPSGDPVEEVNLKGAALDEALEDAGLPKSGSADEKRARLTEHVANQADADTEEQQS